MGGGQMVSADFVLTPAVVFSEGNAGGIGGALGGVLGRKNPLLGAVAGGLKFKEAQTSMLVADARSGIQVAAAEGSTKKADLALGGALFGGGGGAALGGYGNTNEGKIIAAALLDNYNKVVGVVRGDPSLQRDLATIVRQAQRIAALLERMRAASQDRLKKVADAVNQGGIPSSPEAYGEAEIG